MRKSIVLHLAQFHDVAARYASLPTFSLENFFWVRNAPHSWPSALIGSPTQENFFSVVDRIESDQWPPFWIMPTVDALQFSTKLAERGFKEVRRWVGMYLDRDVEAPTVPMIDGYCLDRVSSPSQLADWYGIVKSVNLPNTNFQKAIPGGLMMEPSVSMRLGLLNGVPVTAGLLYTTGGVGGLYFIASLPEYRSRGFASALVASLINDAWEAQANHIVLHASPTGRGIYERLGFASDGQISNFWRVGKF